ncbi:dethiobiotin synthase [Chitinophaga pendula]|nr:dethiobiotin synthase [Chitinophaga sp. MD30]UCJ10230.1 dethiobiotin synthase [Chitinophaga pendula]
MMKRIFITGIGTGVGKTVTAACVTQALQADYWKPIQAGFEDGTDTATVHALLSNSLSIQHKEVYCLREPASPHLAARMEQVQININTILHEADNIRTNGRPLIIEGAGGLLVPVNETVFTIDLIAQLNAAVIIVAQNYLGSINHSLLTARELQRSGIPVLGWIFSGDYHTNETDVIRWSNFPLIGRIQQGQITPAFIAEQAANLRPGLEKALQTS